MAANSFEQDGIPGYERDVESDITLSTICGLIVAVISYGLWHLAFPNTFWFLKLWCAVAIGVMVGLMIDFRRRRSVIGLMFGSLIALLGLTVLVPDLYHQESKLRSIRSLTDVGIDAIVVVEKNGPRRHIVDRDAIDSFEKLASDATLFYPSHETSMRGLHVTLSLTDGQTLSFHARVPARHGNDIALQFRAFLFMQEILVPNAVQWLDGL